MASSTVHSSLVSSTSNQRQARTSPSYDTSSGEERTPAVDGLEDRSPSPSDRDSSYDDDDDIRPLNALSPTHATTMDGINVGSGSSVQAGQASSDEPSRIPQRTAQACNPCRKSKTKCQGIVNEGDSCQNCINKRKQCIFDAKPSGDRAAEHRKRQQQNETVRSIVGEHQWTRIERGENPDDVLAHGTGRLAGRVSGGGVNFLEDMDRICHDTPKDNRFYAQEPFRTILLRHSPTHDEPVPLEPADWHWRSGLIMPRPAFSDNESGPAWIPERRTCEQLIEVFFHRHHPLMPLFIPSQFMEWFESLWLPGGSDQRAPTSYFPPGGIPTPPMTASNSGVPGRTGKENERLQFLPVLFAVLACAEATLSRDQEVLKDGSEFFRHAMINFHFVEALQAPTDGLPQLWRIQTLALLSSHLAGLSCLSGSWNLACLAARDVQLRELHNPSKCGQGSDSQVRRRAFWCVFNLDSMLSRMLSTPPNFALAATHSGLPEALDPDTLAWNAYFVDHQEPAIGPAREPTLAAGFVLLCEANLLATEAIKELYPPGRDRSEDWKAVDSKTDLTNKIEWYEHRLDEQRSRVSGFVHYNGNKASVDVLSLALKDLFAEVGLLIRRVQLPRQGPKTTWDRAQSSLQSSLEIAADALSDDRPRSQLPTSIYLALSVYAIFATSLPLVHARIRVNSPTGPAVEMAAPVVDEYIAKAVSALAKLNSVFDGASVYSDGIRELRELSISWGERKNPGLKVKISTKGRSSTTKKTPSTSTTSSSSASAQPPEVEPRSPEVPMEVELAMMNGLASPFAPAVSHPVQSPTRPKTSPYARPLSGGGNTKAPKGRPGSYPQAPPPSSYHSGLPRKSSWTNGGGQASQGQGARPRSRTMSSSTQSYSTGNGGSTIDPQQLDDHHTVGGYFQPPPPGHRYYDPGPSSYMAAGDGPAGNTSPFGSTSNYSPTTPASFLSASDPHVASVDQWNSRRYSHDSVDQLYSQPQQPSSYVAGSRLTYGAHGGPSARPVYNGGVSYSNPSGPTYDHAYSDPSRDYPTLPQTTRMSPHARSKTVGDSSKLQQHYQLGRPLWDQSPSAASASTGGYLNETGLTPSFSGFPSHAYDTNGTPQLHHPSASSAASASTSLGASGLPVPSYMQQHQQQQHYGYAPAGLGLSLQQQQQHHPQRKDEMSASSSRSSSRGGMHAALGAGYSATRERYDAGDVSMDGNSPAEWERGPSR